MYIKKLKRICGMRGCKNTVSYSLSKTREMGNSIIICEDCLKESLNTVKALKKAETEQNKAEKEEK